MSKKVSSRVITILLISLIIIIAILAYIADRNSLKMRTLYDSPEEMQAALLNETFVYYTSYYHPMDIYRG